MKEHVKSLHFSLCQTPHHSPNCFLKLISTKGALKMFDYPCSLKGVHSSIWNFQWKDSFVCKMFQHSDSTTLLILWYWHLGGTVSKVGLARIELTVDRGIVATAGICIIKAPNRSLHWRTAGGAACARPWLIICAPPVIIFDTSVTGMGDGKSCLGDVKIDRALFMKGLPSVRSESKSFEGSEL